MKSFISNGFELYEEGCLLTMSGKYLNFQKPSPEMIDLEDIVHGLSRERRWANQSVARISVARHSIEVHRLVGKEFKLDALLHDATEAYMRDLPKPLKDLCPEYSVLEDRLDAVIRQHFGLPPMSVEAKMAVKDADIRTMEQEWDNRWEHNGFTEEMDSIAFRSLLMEYLA